MLRKNEFEQAVSDAESDLAQLKARYELWIQGMERVPPVRQRDRLERQLRQLRREQPNNTAMRFKFQTVFARWTSLSTYWARVTRQIEEGTFRRDVLKVRRQRERRDERRRQSEQAPPGEAAAHQALELDLSEGFDLDQEIGAALDALEAPSPARAGAARPSPAKAKGGVFGRPRSSSMPSPPAGAPKPPEVKGAAVPPPPPGRKRPPPPPPGRPQASQAGRPKPPPPPRSAKPSNDGLTRTDVKRVYESYVAARRKNNERVDNLSLDKLEKRLRKMEPELRKKHGGKVDFKVVVKNGRVGLKPVTKKKD